MVAIKVHGSPFSTATMRVLACLYEKEIDFEFIPIDMSKGEHKQEPFISRNPFGQVPAFEDGDLKLFESRAITKYIDLQYGEKGTQLFYPDAKKQAISFLWAEVEAHHFDPASSKLIFELTFKPMFGMTTDQSVVEENEAKLVKVLDVYEENLSKSKYLAGECFTLADLHHLPNLHYLTKIPSAKKLFDSRPHVNAWISDITSRPTWSKVAAMSNQAL